MVLLMVDEEVAGEMESANISDGVIAARNGTITSSSSPNNTTFFHLLLGNVAADEGGKRVGRDGVGAAADEPHGFNESGGEIDLIRITYDIS